jgi:Tol biopolymer transport system component/tRNA A-37 threonylcarbamoyl transferase component Bud32
MPLSAGTHVGPHEILGPLGAGGMGEVYRATDTRLKRQVAIKILPADLAADPERLARFQREAEVLASLNHQHVAAIYGVEESNGVTALVMELVEGPTLADRIAHGPIPIDEALPIARQIAEALEAAHEQGIVHRDLKPANIKVRDDGAVKVLDFGLAKAREKGAKSSGSDVTVNAMSSPTMASPAMSRVGVILGTAAYMSPEQARGKAVDKRTDVWAFGAVLYEMLTGTRAFDGSDITELLASVVKSTPDWSALPADVPPQVVTLIQRCLEKDRQARIGDIAVARFLLSGDAALVAAAVATPAEKRTTRWRAIAPWIATAAVAGAAIGWLIPRRAIEPRPLTHLQMDVVPADQVTPSPNSLTRPSRTAVSISPDGRRVVFSGIHAGVPQVYLRELDHATAAPIAGTDGAYAPFFSPDGAWVAFWTGDNKIKKVPAAGGPTATICDLPQGQFWGASWSEDGNIYFSTRQGIAKVSAAGGAPTDVVKLDLTKSGRLGLPQLLPGGKNLLFTSPPKIVVRSLDSGEERTIIEDGADARYVRTGHLLYMKAGTLMAVPFDPRSARVTGAPVALLENVMQGMYAGNSNDETLAGQFAVSDSGTLVYASGGTVPMRPSTLVFVDRNGSVQAVPGSTPRGLYLNPRLSHDGQKIAVESKADVNEGTDVWVYDIARGSPTRVTFDGGNRPVWSPDDKRILYGHFEKGVANLYIVNADGTGKPERLTTNTFGQAPASWSAATNAVAVIQRPTTETFGIFVMPMDGAGPRQPTLFLESKFALLYPEFSPDGHWMAYVSAESGLNELYVQAYPGGGQKTRISTAGGWEPIWIGNGRELLYRTYTPPPQNDRLLMSAAVRSLSPLRIDPPRLLLDMKQLQYDATTPLRAWDATADGQRFVMVRVGESTDKPVTALHVVLNWTDELKRRVPTK